MDFSLEWVRNQNMEVEHMYDVVKVSDKQSEFELNLWATEENITEAQKAQVFLEAGLPLQKSWVMQSLPVIIQQDSRALIQNILKNIVNWSEDLQLEFGSGLLNCITRNLLPEDLKYESLELSLTFLSFYSKTLQNRWLPVFKSLLPQIPLPLIRSKIVPELMLLSDFSQKQITRQVSCQLLSSLAELLQKDFKGPLLQRIKALSQDTSPEVREEMAKAWVSIITHFGKPLIEDTAFFDILKLLEDEVENVKSGGMRLLILSTGMVGEGFFVKEVTGVLLKSVYNAESPKVEEVIAEHLGELVVGCRGRLKEENLRLVRKLSAKEANIRKWVAFNFPGLAQGLNTCTELKDIALTLSNDSCVEVKCALAAGFHEVVFTSPQCKILKKISLKLIEDPDTRPIIFKKMLTWSSLFDPSQFLIKYIKYLTQSIDWRSQVHLLTNFQACFSKFNLKEILDHLVPLLLHKMLTACWPIKLASCNLLSEIIHNTFYISRKLDICNILKEKLLRSNSCYDRQLFIEFASQIARLNSKKFFFKYIFEDFLVLANDKSRSVKIKFLMAAPNIGVYTQAEQILAAIKEAELQEATAFELREKVKEYFKGKEFRDRFSENLQVDREKEAFEAQLELKEVKELQNFKKKTVDEFAIKPSSEAKQVKASLKTRIHSESIDPKPRNTRSSAVFKQIVPVKRK